MSEPDESYIAMEVSSIGSELGSESGEFDEVHSTTQNMTTLHKSKSAELDLRRMKSGPLPKLSEEITTNIDFENQSGQAKP